MPLGHTLIGQFLKKTSMRFSFISNVIIIYKSIDFAPTKCHMKCIWVESRSFLEKKKKEKKKLKAGIILVEIFKTKNVKYKENLRRIFNKVSTYTYSMSHLIYQDWWIWREGLDLYWKICLFGGREVESSRFGKKLVYFQSTLLYFPSFSLLPPSIQTGYS